MRDAGRRLFQRFSISAFSFQFSVLFFNAKLPPLAVSQNVLQKVPRAPSAAAVRLPTVMFPHQGMGLWFCLTRYLSSSSSSKNGNVLRLCCSQLFSNSKRAKE